ncbi:MAG: hypothetical protein ABI920_17980 [Casimicrobiaceae bacterium]
MKNITITLDEATAAWARLRAAEEGTSVSRLVGEMLHGRMLRDAAYEDAMQRFLVKQPKLLGKAGGHYPTRDEVHKR